MKAILPAIFLLGCLASGCKKSGGAGSSAPIATKTDATSIFGAINSLWTVRLKPSLTKKTQTYSNFSLTDSSGGKAAVNGIYSTQNNSSSSGSVSSGTVNVTIEFTNFSLDGLTLNGTLKFVDSYETRTDCGSAGCATASHKSISYSTVDTTAAVAVGIKLKAGGHTISDDINLVSDEAYSTFTVKIINSKRVTFNLDY